MDISSPDCQVVMDKQRTQYLLFPGKNGRCSKITENSKKTECSDIWIRLPRHIWPKSWSGVEDPVVLLERNLYGHPLAGLLWERQFEKILLKYGWEKVSNWECLFVHREKGLFLFVYVDDIKLAGKKQNIDPMWKVLNKDVGLGEPTSFFDHVYLGWPGRWGPKGMSQTGGGGLARVPNLRVCKHPLENGVAHAGEKDALTSCRGTV